MVKAEMTSHLSYEYNDTQKKNTDNSRNSFDTNNLKTELGVVKVNVSRDRQREFETEIEDYFQQ